MVRMVKEVVDSVVDGLKASPSMLAIILLNAIMLAAMSWFLGALVTAQQSRYDALLKLCMGKMTP